MRRREVITLLGGAAAWPLAARAQERVRRIGMISGISDEAAMRERLSVFLPTLQRLGWVEGRSVQIEYRWGKGNAETLRRDAMELAALAPDVIVATGGATMTYMLQATRTVPIVFVIVPDPVGSGFVKSLARPGGNATGFMQFEYSLSGKWLELLKQIAPAVSRAAIL
jgi:putative ABC transport system substrate-binding protein